MSSFWNIGTAPPSPKTLLEEQAQALEKQTSGKLIGELFWRSERNRGFFVSLVVRVPALGDYRHTILELHLPPTSYPINKGFPGHAVNLNGEPILEWKPIAHNEAELIEYLKQALGSPETASLLASLLSMAGQESPQAA